MYDSRIARWLTTDPAGQFASPYIAMGGDPINGIDKDGGEMHEDPPAEGHVDENPSSSSFGMTYHDGGYITPSLNDITVTAGGGRSSFNYDQFAAYYDIGKEQGLSDYELQKNAPKAFPNMSSNEWAYTITPHLMEIQALETIIMVKVSKI